jgi:predicted nucleic acid-binding protein
MIVDSTVLISLGNLGQIELINKCIIPENILKEITNEPAKSALFNLKFQKVIPSEKSIKQSLKILGDKYETGDSDIVALLIDSPSSIIATDDKRLRNVCRALGGKVTGTLGILINSVKKQNISKEEALMLLDKLNEIGFRMSLELYNTVREKIIQFEF